MNKELYVQLRKHLDKQPGGFPKTQSGAEIDILKRFYTPEQAKIALKMTTIPEPAVKISAMRIKINSPAYMLPKSRSASETGFASSATVSRIRLNAMMKGAAMMAGPLKDGIIGCSIRSWTRASSSTPRPRPRPSSWRPT